MNEDSGETCDPKTDKSAEREHARAYVRIKTDGTVDTLLWSKANHPDESFFQSVSRTLGAETLESILCCRAEGDPEKISPAIYMLVDEDGYMKWDAEERPAHVNRIASVIYYGPVEEGKPFHYILGDVAFCTEVEGYSGPDFAPFLFKDAMKWDEFLTNVVSKMADSIVQIPDRIELPQPEIVSFDSNEELVDYLKTGKRKGGKSN